MVATDVFCEGLERWEAKQAIRFKLLLSLSVWAGYLCVVAFTGKKGGMRNLFLFEWRTLVGFGSSEAVHHPLAFFDTHSFCLVKYPNSSEYNIKHSTYRHVHHDHPKVPYSCTPPIDPPMSFPKFIPSSPPSTAQTISSTYPAPSRS